MAKGGKVGNALVWVLLVLLIIGLAGFGITNFGGTVRAIGKVGDQEISTNAYARAVQQELQALSAQTGRNVPFAEGQAMGVDRMVLERLVTLAALDDEAARIGISVGDARVAREIRAMPGLAGVSGQFDRDGYRFALERLGFTEAQFEAQVRADIARGILQGAVAGGFQGSTVLADAIWDHIAERRSFSVLRLTEADLDTPLPEPDEAALRAFHAGNPDLYTRPAARRITYAALLPENLVDQAMPDEALLRRAYESRLAEFVQPERRLVERLVFPSAEAAEAARNRLDAGQVSFEVLVAERGLTLDDVDMGDVAEDDLGAAGAVVFAMDEPGVVGPLPTPLGPALFRMNAVLAAQETSYDEARPLLVEELATDAARRLIADRIDDIDDLLAGGATLEDLADEPGIVVETIEVIPGASEGLMAYPAFRERVTRVTDRDFPEVFRLEDGGIAALRLDAEVPARALAYDEVAERVAADARAAALRAALIELRDRAAEAVAAGAGLASFGIVTNHAALPRDGRVDGAPPDLLTRIFAMDEGALLPVAEGDFVALIRLDAILPADPEAPEAAFLRQAWVMQSGQEMGDDAFALFARDALTRARIQINDAAVQAVNANLR
ncbi:MAG: peptidylprolyl isomerase [Gemmobacter sp.]